MRGENMQINSRVIFSMRNGKRGGELYERARNSNRKYYQKTELPEVIRRHVEEFIEPIILEAKKRFGIKSLYVEYFIDPDPKAPLGSHTSFMATAHLTFNASITDPAIARYVVYHELAHYIIDAFTFSLRGREIAQSRREWSCDMLAILYGGSVVVEGLNRCTRPNGWIASLLSSKEKINSTNDFRELIPKIIEMSYIAEELRV